MQQTQKTSQEKGDRSSLENEILTVEELRRACTVRGEWRRELRLYLDTIIGVVTRVWVDGAD